MAVSTHSGHSSSFFSPLPAEHYNNILYQRPSEVCGSIIGEKQKKKKKPLEEAGRNARVITFFSPLSLSPGRTSGQKSFFFFFFFPPAVIYCYSMMNDDRFDYSALRRTRNPLHARDFCPTVIVAFRYLACVLQNGVYSR